MAPLVVAPFLPPPVEQGARGGAASLAMSEAERLTVLRDLLGTTDPALAPFPTAIRDVVRGRYARYVLPIFASHWPDAVNGKAARKLRFLSCDLYATSPYTVLFASERPPFVIGALRKVGTSVGLAPAQLALWSGRAVRLASHLLDERIQRRIVYIAAFIAAVDHVFDHCMENIPPAERGRRMRGLLDGSWTPADDMRGAPGAADDAGPLLAVRALFDAMRRDVDPAGRPAFELAMQRIFEWLDSEVNAMTGVPDPTGACWRMAGVLGTIDGLIYPVHGYTGAEARTWMYSVSLFVQVMDDWIDAEKDALDVRPTPVTNGHWTIDTVRATWQSTVDGLEALVRRSGVDDPAYLTFVIDTYRMMTHEVMEAMCKGSAA